MISRLAQVNAARLRIAARPSAAYGASRAARGFANTRNPVEFSMARPGSSKSQTVSLQHGKRRVPQVRDQHGRRRVGDAQRWPRILHGQLRSQSAGPEYRQLVVIDLWVTDIQVTPAQVHADALGVAQVDRSAMNIGKPRRDLNGPDGIGRR